jgi:protein-S-isoprenylcysteine O-methyltransferase Ste14
MNLEPMALVRDAWIALMLYWLVSAFKVKQMKYLAPAHVRIIQLLFLVPACFLLFPRYRPGVLHMAVLPQTSTVEWIGAAITFAGVAFAIWARYVLGSNWSSAVAIREGHELIQTGPYRLIRHPIYTGIIAAAWGTAIAVGELGAFLGVILIALGFTYKGKQEELNMERTFGESWIAHRLRTGMFLPRMR